MRCTLVRKATLFGDSQPQFARQSSNISLSDCPVGGVLGFFAPGVKSRCRSTCIQFGCATFGAVRRPSLVVGPNCTCRISGAINATTRVCLKSVWSPMTGTQVPAPFAVQQPQWHSSTIAFAATLARAPKKAGFAPSATAARTDATSNPVGNFIDSKYVGG